MANDAAPVGTDVPKRRWKDILWAVQAPPEVSGWMDWSTGILYLNSQVEGPEDLEKLLAGERTGDVRELIATITHEDVHFQQMVTTGYMYRWACVLYDKLVRAMKPLRRELDSYIDNPDPRTLLDIEHQIIDANRQDLRNHLGKLDRPGPNGVTVRDLLEAHAFLVEKKSHWQGLNPPGYFQMLDDAPAPEYRSAYDLARFRLGDNVAFAWFPLIASLCLWAEDPPWAFDVLVDEMASWTLPQPPEKFDRDTARKILAKVPRIIGPAADLSNTLAHPLYTPAVLSIHEKCAQGFRMLEFLADPVTKLRPIVSDVLRPIAFRANDKDQFAVWVPPNFDQELVPVLLIYSVLASRVLGLDSFEGGARTRVSGYEWATRPLPYLGGIEIDAAHLQSCDISELDVLLPAKRPPGQRQQLCARWGKCFISFDLDGDAPPWTRSEVRRFIAAIQRSNPAFPVYLNMHPQGGMFQLWFGSLADPSAHLNQGWALHAGHDSVLKYLFESIDAIVAMAKQMGFQARPLIQSLLTSYPHEAAVQIVDRTFGSQLNYHCPCC